MKAFTDIEQSKKLAEILPIESADMRYAPFGDTHPWFWDGNLLENGAIPCWSLAALLEIIPEVLVERRIPDAWDCVSYAECQMTSANNFENLIDACVEVIIKLHKQKFL